ncbi:50S ribosomal protein L6 [Candidatus Nesciobacter abundans]|uniref:50S ribosomal protein L6 n=1 Tax=Candidatus Nesciobacter abundans TaxID=2601668 RepID=A0A5C0UFN9_9PROT|nr:50S ribosomal protein L6 [Candidatus Nesciobacter abundans]QEK38916.1 50S ribosomal protein L6 [Candidatus Nesciobacter abundans]
MSINALKPIKLEKEVTVVLDGDSASMKSSAGEHVMQIPSFLNLEMYEEEDQKFLKFSTEDKKHIPMLGTIKAILKSFIVGLTKGHVKTLKLEGVGHKAEVSGDILKLSLGYSHPINADIPNGVNVSVSKNELKITGIDKQKVNQFSATVQSFRAFKPYKGPKILDSDKIYIMKERKK